MKKKAPLLIVLTPVFNEAWILPAFLKATGLWADYIIIADQMSTDGSRDLYARFDELKKEGIKNAKSDCKLIVIDNPRKEMHQAATRRLLFEEVKKIVGDKILFTLDADEFLSGNFPETEGWKKIINSEPGDVFEFKWMNLCPVPTKYSSWVPYYWALHVDEDSLNGEFPDNFIHEWRLPWPEHVKHEYVINDICFIHYARVNVIRQANKSRFYQISQSASLGKYSGVGFYRMYHPIMDEKSYDVPADLYGYYQSQGIDITLMLNLNDEGKHYSEEVMRHIEEKGLHFFHKLDVWDADFLQKTGLYDPRTRFDKMMHWYLAKTNRWSESFLIRIIDYILKRVY